VIYCLILLILLILCRLLIFNLLIYRRQDSQRRKPSMNYNKNNYHDIISANNVNIQPGMNSIDLTLNVNNK